MMGRGSLGSVEQLRDRSAVTGLQQANEAAESLEVDADRIRLARLGLNGLSCRM